MVRISRHAATHAATVLGAIAGAMALRTLLRRVVAPVRAESTEAEAAEALPTPPTPDGPHTAEDGMVVEDGRSPSFFGRAMAFARRGCTATVIVLIVLAGGTGVWAAIVRPDTAIPQPGPSSILLTFGLTHPASSPITVEMYIQDLSYVGSGTSTSVGLSITVTGRDLTFPGWKLLVKVPTGVHVIRALPEQPPTGRVSRDAAGYAVVSSTPGPIPAGDYMETLTWDGLDSGPMQVQGASLVAAFPTVVVENGLSASIMEDPSRLARVAPLTVSRQLDPGGSDYAYFAGMPPDSQDFPTWSWKPETGVTGLGFAGVPALTVEARSAVADERARSAEFLSGILFGVAAAAVIAAIQEFVTSATRRKRGTNARPSGA